MGNDIGWIKLHRKLLKNPIMLNAELLQLFIYCLLRANYEDNFIIWNGKKMLVKTGSFVSGLFTICEYLNQKQTSTYRRLQTLEELGYISIRAENKFSVITVLKYSSYQILIDTVGKPMENKRKTDGKQTETDNNDNNEKNDKKEDITAIAVPTKDDLIDSLIKDFSSQYEEANRIAYKVFIGKDRKAMGGILAYYKKQKPQADSLTARQDLSKVFRAVITTDFKNEYLNGVSISKLNTSFNDYYLALKSKQSADVTVNDLS